MRLTATMFQTLDGVVQGPGAPDEDRSGGFDRGGWLAPYADDGMNEVVTTVFGRAAAFLLGRRTYDIFAAYWPARSTDSLSRPACARSGMTSAKSSLDPVRPGSRTTRPPRAPATRRASGSAGRLTAASVPLGTRRPW